MGENKFKAIRSIAAIVLVIGLIVYPLRVPYTGAYFTHIASPQSSPVALKFNRHNFSLDVQMYIDGSHLVANMNIPSGYGFYADDMIIESTEITYNGISSQELPISTTPNGTHLKLVFDWDQASSFNYNDASLYFKIIGKGSGNGISGLGERFVFDGDGELVPVAPTPTPQPILNPSSIMKSEVKAEIKAEIELEAESEVRPESEVMPEPEVRPESEKESELEVKPQVEAEAEVMPELEPIPELTLDSTADATEDSE